GNAPDRRHGPRGLPAGPPRDARRRATPGRGRRRTAQPGAPCGGEAPVYAMKGPRILALLGLLAALGEAPLLHAQAPEECRRQCSLDLVACQNACLDSRDFDGCLARRPRLRGAPAASTWRCSSSRVEGEALVLRVRLLVTDVEAVAAV